MLATAVPIRFFALVVALSIPLWILGALPQMRSLLPFDLPISALVAFCPAAAALLLLFQRGGWKTTGELLARVGDYRRGVILWYLAAVIVMPAILVLSYLVMRTIGRSLPDPAISIQSVALMFVLFFASACGEELGWQGYAFGPLQARWGTRNAALLLGVVWAAWHAISFVQTGHSVNWVLWQSASTVALRVLIVWVYVGTGGGLALRPDGDCNLDVDPRRRGTWLVRRQGAGPLGWKPHRGGAIRRTIRSFRPAV